MPSSEFREWMEYARIEPFGAIRDNWHMATLAYILVKAHSDPKKQRRKLSVDDFFYRDVETEQDEKRNRIMSFFGKLKNGRSR